MIQLDSFQISVKGGDFGRMAFGEYFFSYWYGIGLKVEVKSDYPLLVAENASIMPSCVHQCRISSFSIDHRFLHLEY
jgi:hypothetical protein